jgi:hypothetical protein
VAGNQLAIVQFGSAVVQAMGFTENNVHALTPVVLQA